MAGMRTCPSCVPHPLETRKEEFCRNKTTRRRFSVKAVNKMTDADSSGRKLQTSRHSALFKDANQKPDTGTSSAYPPNHLEECPGISVEFHVIIHEEWQFDPGKDRVCIRFGINRLGNWKVDYAQMEPAKDFETTKHLRLIGNFTIPWDITHRTIPYKYVVSKNAQSKLQTEFEYITGRHQGSVNRALIIPGSPVWKKTGFFRKYDDIIRQRPTKWVGFRYRECTADELMNNRKCALEAMFPRWPGFCGMEKSSLIDSRLTAEEALEEFYSVVDSIKSVPVWEDSQPGSKPEFFRPDSLTDEIVTETICCHIQPQLEALTGRKEDLLSYAIALSVLVEKYKLHLNVNQLAVLLNALKIHPDMELRRCVDYDVLKTQIKDLTMAVKSVEHVIRIYCALPSNDHWEFTWLLALPVLHFMQQDLSPEIPDPTTPQWWGLQNLVEDVSKFRKKSGLTRPPMNQIKPLCSVDHLMARSLLYSLTLEQLEFVVNAGVGHLSEYLQALQSKLSIWDERKQFWEGFDRCRGTDKLRSLLTKLATETTASTSYTTPRVDDQTLNKCGVIACVQLLDKIPSYVEEIDQLQEESHGLGFSNIDDKEILRLLLFVKDITFWFMHKLMITGENINAASQDDTPSKREHSAKQLELVDYFTRSRLQQTFECFSKWMDKQSPGTVVSIVEEVKMWSKILQSDILPDRLKQQWEDLVLSKLDGRMSKVEDKKLMLETYLGVSDNSLHPVIAGSLDGQIEKAVYSLLEKPGWQKKAVPALVTKFMKLLCGTSGNLTAHATLLKLVLRKKCPTSSTSTSAGWMDWLRNLLLWPLWKTFLELTGDASHARKPLDPEGQLVSQAESVLITTETSLRDRSITVEQLRLLQENQNRFLELCKVWDIHNQDTSICRKAKASLKARLEEMRQYEQQKRLDDIVVDEKEQQKEAEVSEANQMVERLKSELERQGREAAGVAQHNKALQENVGGLESRLSSADAALQEARQAVASLLQRRLDEEEQEKKTAVSEAKQEVGCLESELERQEIEAAGVAQHNEALQENVGELELQLSNANPALQELNQRVTFLQKELDEKEREKKTAVSEAKKEVGRLESELERQEIEAAGVAQHNKALQKNVGELESRLSSADAALQEARQAVASLQRRLDEEEQEKKTAVSEAKQEVGRLESELERQEIEAAGVAQHNKALQKNVGELESQLSIANAALLQELNLRVAFLQKELDEKELEKKTAEQETDRVQSELERQRNETSRVTQLQKDVSHLELLLSNAESVIDSRKESEEGLTISSQNIQLSSTKLGEGSYAEVCIANWRGCLVAVKKLFEELAQVQRYVDLFKQEVSVAWKVHHPNVAAVCGVVLEKEGKKTKAWIVMELLQGSMSGVIDASSKEEVGALTLREQVDLAHDSLCGLDYLHTLPRTVLHGDIRPTNILVTAMMKAKLGDLGAARYSDASLSAGPLSPVYTAPERMYGQTIAKSKETDIYSMGVTICELFTAATPFRDKRGDQMHLIRQRSVRSVCLQMVSDDPRVRPSASEALSLIDRLYVEDEYKGCPPKRMVKGKVDGLQDVTLVHHVVK